MIRPTTPLGFKITHTAVLPLLLFVLLVSPAYSASSIQVTWDANTESDLAGYKIYKRTLPSQDFGQPIFSGMPGNPSSPSTTVAGLNGGTTYGFIATAFDTAGNESAPTTEVPITFPPSSPPPPSPPPADTTAPTVTLTAPSAGTVSGMVMVSATASDNVGIVGVQFRLQGANLGSEDTSSPYSTSWNTATVANGTYTLTAIARDAAGNTKTSGSIVVTVSSNSTPPPPSAFSISNLAVASGQTYVVPTSGLQPGGRVYIDRAFTFTTIPAGLQGAAYVRTANDDKAATTSAFLSFTVNQPVSVSVAHDVRITPKPSWLSTFTDTGTSLGTSDTTLRLFVRSFPAGTITLGGNAGDGLSMYSVIVKSESGTPDDTTAPTITLTAPSAGTVSGTVTVTASASDNVGVVGVQFRLQGANLGPEDISSPYSISWDTTTVTNGAYTLSASARDAAGNTKTSGSIVVTVSNSTTPPPDTTPPTVTLSAPSTSSVSGTVTVTASANDNVGITGVQFRIQGANLGPEDISSPYSISWDTTTMPNGPYTLSAIARDAAGNTTTAAPRTVTVSNSSTPPTSPQNHDLNGDGKADLIWRNTKTGEVAGWLLNGTSIATSGLLGQLPMDWTMSGVGDLNGDTKADLVWRNSISGAVVIWLMDGLTITSTGFLGAVATSWDIQAIEDMDGDGKADLLWRNTTDGHTAIWLMNGTAIVSTGFPAGVSLGWQIAGVGDVNGDGKADVIWRHDTSSTVAIWLMNGLTITSTGFPGSAPTVWEIQALGDANGDGKADLVWRNATDGNTAIWLMNGTAIAASGFPGTVSRTWQMSGANDVNGDGKADIIWRNRSNGGVAVWLMNGLTITSTGFPGATSTDWEIQ
ncbi:Ig-like domain-containing protein [Candidatus Nitrospira allomarina]|uniref:Ig-like domain-containing protein n=1 Tax=Candidatus Nitrospira allomarina TaxID=3020900 RepID=A0AA96GAW8_9BACT|nr:Ig-like domain-containing protein [Candidatus Nitrospira allomarina]WNM57962.1 Ig-like domain-containing protein [Candidatus Nitrospira allomarina]